MKSSSDVVALIPAFNEEKNIAEAVERTKSRIENVVVVDDGSSDRTAEIAKGKGATVIRHAANLGKGAALKTGLDHVLREMPTVKCVVIIDADLQFRPEDAPSLVEPVVSGYADVVMGFRDFSKVPFRHRLGNFVWKTAFNLLFGTKLKDTNCGYVALTADAAKRVGSFHGGYIIETQLLAESVKNGLRIRQVPVTVEYRKMSAVPRGIRVVLGVLLFTVLEGVKYRLGR
ncbi:MAG: glycosyltransferase family 2 protein [Candidatus Aenigmatarchaeota archaeon]